jgi:phosphate transport system protein
MGELRLRYHQQLDIIEGKVIQLFALVAEGLVAATEALLSGDTEVARLLTEREDLIDNLYRETETLVNSQMALQSPAAGDLRFLLSVLRIVPELERSHDLVEHIAHRARHTLREELTPRARGLVEQMGTIGAEMWRQAADSWYERDGRAGALLSVRDEEVDELHAALTAELGSGRMSLPVAMDMALVARFYERLGDHAVNIARRVEYLAGPAGAAPSKLARPAPRVETLAAPTDEAT